jgi:NAD(P)-dependent dehydrogenase (short-subunit alcohol dehydrogenase family)
MDASAAHTSPAGASGRHPPVVLITGCSSGIGRATARRFARAGYRVYASMRRPQAGAELRAEADAQGWMLSTPALDVNSDTSVEAAVSMLLAETGGRLDVLVNNAGYYCYGPIEETSPDELRAQLETNVVGVLRVTRAVLPTMRARRRGAIVNLSSISGRVVIPIAGPYHASKWALEALSEALRYEVASFGIRVTLVEPGPFQTELHTKEMRTRQSLREGSPYAPLMRAYEYESGKLRRGDVELVAETIHRVATRRRPRLRWPIGPSAFTGGVLRRFVPDGLYERIVEWVFHRKRRLAADSGPSQTSPSGAAPGTHQG